MGAPRGQADEGATGQDRPHRGGDPQGQAEWPAWHQLSAGPVHTGVRSSVERGSSLTEDKRREGLCVGHQSSKSNHRPLQTREGTAAVKTSHACCRGCGASALPAPWWPRRLVWHRGGGTLPWPLRELRTERPHAPAAPPRSMPEGPTARAGTHTVPHIQSGVCTRLKGGNHSCQQLMDGWTEWACVLTTRTRLATNVMY